MLAEANGAGLPGQILALDRSAEEVDGIFASAADRLGRGLAVFEALTDRLGAVSGDLASRDMDATRDSLSGVVAVLRGLSAGLADGATALEAIGRQGDAASRAVSHMLTQIRYVGAIARCSRIEEATLSTRGRGVFAEVGGLVETALETIERCSGDHGRLERMLGPAIRSQQAFAAKYTVPLLVLAVELETSLGQIEECRRRGAVITGDASRQAQRIGDAVSSALIALQCGDSTRQRLEHTRHTMQLGHGLALGAGSGELGGADRLGAMGMLAELAFVQLNDTADSMQRDIAQIDQALGTLSTEIDAVIDLGSPDHQGDVHQIAALLAALEAKLGEASDMIGQCRATRAGVDQVTDAVAILVRSFGDTSTSLARTVRDIVLVGMNAGLYASRLGEQGKSMVAIARELKGAADQIGVHAATLLPVLGQMQASLAGLAKQTSDRSQRLAGLDGTMQASLGAMKTRGVTLAQVLEALASDSIAFAANVDDARAAFAGANVIRQAIADAAGRQREGAAACPSPPDADAGRVAAFLEREVMPRYTIAIERTLFRQVVGASGGAGVAMAEVEEDDTSWEF